MRMLSNVPAGQRRGWLVRRVRVDLYGSEGWGSSPSERATGQRKDSKTLAQGFGPYSSKVPQLGGCYRVPHLPALASRSEGPVADLRLFITALTSQNALTGLRHCHHTA